MTEHADDSQDILDIRDTEESEWHHKEDGDAAKEEDDSGWTHLHIVHPDPLAQEGALVTSLHQV